MTSTHPPAATHADPAANANASANGNANANTNGTGNANGQPHHHSDGETYSLPPLGSNPGLPGTTSPGSFSPFDAQNEPRIKPGSRGAATFASPDTPGMPPLPSKTAWDFLPEGWTTDEVSDEATKRRSDEVDGNECEFRQGDGSLRRVWYPKGFKPLTQLEHARLGVVTQQMQRVAERETHLTAEQVRDEVAAGRMVIPANKSHLGYRLDPMAIGRASKTKINANMGASPVSSGTDEEIEKLRWAERWGADTVMDLSTGGDLDQCREAIIQASNVPIGTVPIYSMIIGKKIEDLDENLILETVKHQAAEGVDYFTMHAGILNRHIKYAKNRLIGLVSRGGSMLAKWMLHHNAQNPFNTAWEDICDVMREHDVTFSIGDGCRPGGLADATDKLQLAELEEIGRLTERAWRKGVQVMVEGPGHVPLDQIEYNMKIERTLCHGAPFYVLGPLVTDMFPGYDHMTSSIGASNAGYHGASMLCYVTPKEHLGLPKKDDVKQGCVAYKIAAHSADIALGIPHTRDRDDQLTKARAALNWQEHFDLSFDPDTARAYHDEDMDVDTDFCAMCGHDWCSVRISKEIQDWASGKDQQYEWDKPKRSDALTEQQQQILEQRGYLKPEEIHKLAAKTKKVMQRAGSSPSPATSESPATSDASHQTGAEDGPAHTEEETKPSCHSDYLDPDEAKKRQQENLVHLDTREAHGLNKNDSLI